MAAFTTNGVEHSVSCHCLTFSFLLWKLKNTFTTFPVSSKVFRCLEHTNNCFIFSLIRAEMTRSHYNPCFPRIKLTFSNIKFSLKYKILQSILITFDFNPVSIRRTRETGHMKGEKICITRHAIHQARFVQLIFKPLCSIIA